MCPGSCKITKLGNISESTRLKLLDSTYFKVKTRETQGNFISTINNTDRLVLDFINELDIDSKGFLIEYWFQFQKEGEKLTPHCDYNTKARKELPTSNIARFLKDKNLNYYLSPKTIAVYLEISSDLLGGDLCISKDFTYLSENVTEDRILNGLFERYSPIQGEVLQFEGSKYYHWIDRVLKGTRKSLLINFWPKDLEHE